MTNKIKTVSVIGCAVVVIACYIFYSGSVSQSYYEICRPSSCSLIGGYETKVVEDIPEGYQLSVYDMIDDMDEMDITEITYELKNPVNETIYLLNELCYYSGENSERILVLEKDRNHSGVSDYENAVILPPGESVFFREYVLVPEGMKEIRAHRGWGVEDSQEEVVIRL